jgi:hypothetical protein
LLKTIIRRVGTLKLAPGSSSNVGDGFPLYPFSFQIHHSYITPQYKTHMYPSLTFSPIHRYIITCKLICRSGAKIENGSHSRLCQQKIRTQTQKVRKEPALAHTHTHTHIFIDCTNNIFYIRPTIVLPRSLRLVARNFSLIISCCTPLSKTFGGFW